METKDDGNIRSFEGGATRDTTEGKIDMEGFTHPMVMKQFAKFMSMNRMQSDGKLRDSDNWQSGMPKKVYMKSLRRHHDEAWETYRGYPSENGMIAALCGIMFNSMGMLLEILREQDMQLEDFDGTEPTPEMAKRLSAIEFAEVKEILSKAEYITQPVVTNDDTVAEDLMPVDPWVKASPLEHYRCMHNGIAKAHKDRRYRVPKVPWEGEKQEGIPLVIPSDYNHCIDVGHNEGYDYPHAPQEHLILDTAPTCYVHQDGMISCRNFYDQHCQANTNPPHDCPNVGMKGN